MKKLVYPRPLKPGDTVALTAPSSPVPAVNLKAAIKSVKLLGLNPVVMPSCREHHGYMAGTDAQRASDLNELFPAKTSPGSSACAAASEPCVCFPCWILI